MDDHDPEDIAVLRREWREIRDKDSVKRWKIWCRVTNRYSGLSLTRFSDKLVALAGLAAEMAKGWDDVAFYDAFLAFFVLFIGDWKYAIV